MQIIKSFEVSKPKSSEWKLDASNSNVILSNFDKLLETKHNNYEQKKIVFQGWVRTTMLKWKDTRITLLKCRWYSKKEETFRMK